MDGFRREKFRRFLAVMAVMMAVAVSAACGAEGSKAQGGTGQDVEANGPVEGETGGASGEEEKGDAADGENAGDTRQVSGQEGVVPISVNNDTVELGTLAVFEPSDNLEANSGRAIAGSDEEQLQQERIAGGAVGEVVSENLEPLTGIADYSEGEFVTVYGATAE